MAMLDVSDFVLAALYLGNCVSRRRLNIVLGVYGYLIGMDADMDYVCSSETGYYSPEVDATLDELVAAGLVKRRSCGFSLTDASYGAEAVRRLSEEGVDVALLHTLLRRYRKLSLDELELIIYTVLLGDMASKCRDIYKRWRQIENKRRELALSIYRKGMATLQLAARLAGTSIDEFIAYAVEHGVYAGYLLDLRDIEAAERDASHLRQAM